MSLLFLFFCLFVKFFGKIKKPRGWPLWHAQCDQIQTFLFLLILTLGGEQKKIFDKKVKIKTLFKYAHRHIHTHGRIDTTRHTHIMARNVRHSNWIQIIQKRPALLFCRVVVCLLIISLISSDFNLTRHFETLKKKKKPVTQRMSMCLLLCRILFLRDIEFKTNKKHRGIFKK